jgi:hypothetical protein
MKCEMQHRISRTKNMRTLRGTKIMIEFVFFVAQSLGGLGGKAVMLFAEIARSQALSRLPVGHILRRLININQIAVQKGNLISKTCESCVSLFTARRPFQHPERFSGPPRGDECSREFKYRSCLKKRKKDHLHCLDETGYIASCFGSGLTWRFSFLLLVVNLKQKKIKLRLLRHFVCHFLGHLRSKLR